MCTHMHYRVLGVDSLRIQGPVEREYLNNSGQAGQSVNAIEVREISHFQIISNLIVVAAFGPERQ